MRFVFIFIFSSLSSFGQAYDSLLYQTNQITNDTERVNQLYQNGFNLRTIDIEIALKFAESAQKAAIKSKSIKHIAKSENLLGLLYYKKSNFPKTIYFLNQALQHNQAIQYEMGIAMNQANLGNVYSDLNYYNLAEDAYLKSLHISNKLNNLQQVTRCLINLGTLKYSLQQYDASVRQFRTALEYAKQIGDIQLTSACYNNIGSIYKEELKLDSALLYLEESLKLKELIDNETELADSYLNIASVYTAQKKYNQAENYLMLAQNIASTHHLLDVMTLYYQIKSELYEAQTDYANALRFFKKYHYLKDSLSVNVITKNQLATNNTTTIQETTSHTSYYLWLVYLILPIIITYFLIKNKR